MNKTMITILTFCLIAICLAGTPAFAGCVKQSSGFTIVDSSICTAIGQWYCLGDKTTYYNWTGCGGSAPQCACGKTCTNDPGTGTIAIKYPYIDADPVHPGCKDGAGGCKYGPGEPQKSDAPVCSCQ